jgi:hypothetical protein
MFKTFVSLLSGQASYVHTSRRDFSPLYKGRQSFHSPNQTKNTPTLLLAKGTATGAAMSRHVLSRRPGKTRRRCPKFDRRYEGEPALRVSRSTRGQDVHVNVPVLQPI